jgi:DNA-binding response OmpR family regulator
MPQHSSSAARNTSRVTLLVVEDDMAIRDALVDGLIDAGFTVHAAEDGAEAIQMMAAAKPDLVLLDMMMPRMTGWQVIDEMKEQPALREIPVVVVTAARYVGSVPMGYPVWVKPLRLEPLTRSIRAYFGSATGSPEPGN